MTHKTTFVVIGSLLLSGALGGLRAQDEAGATRHALSFEGEAALLTVAIKPDKTAEFERIMGRVRDALMKSADPNRRAQATGWKVMRLQQALPDGNVAYVHIIHPVVPGADYSVMQLLYDAFPEERQALYESYRGAFAKNLSLATGAIPVDLAKQNP